MRFTIWKCPINSHLRNKNCWKAISGRRGRWFGSGSLCNLIHPQSSSRNAPLRKAGFWETTGDESVCYLCCGIWPSEVRMEIRRLRTSFYNSIAFFGKAQSSISRNCPSNLFLKDCFLECPNYFSRRLVRLTTNFCTLRPPLPDPPLFIDVG